MRMDTQTPTHGIVVFTVRARLPNLPLLAVVQTCEPRSQESANMVHRRGAVEVPFHETLRVGLTLIEIDRIHVIATEGEYFLPVHSLVVVAARLSELSGDAPDAEHRCASAVHEHEAHLE